MMSKGDEGSWSIMLDRFRSEENAQEKNKLLYGLGNLQFNFFPTFYLKILFTIFLNNHF